jgi:3-deoxy-D-manno-octulosonic-acid transferase
MSILEAVYTGGLHLARPLLPLLARGEGKLARGVRGRRGALQRMETWAAAHRDRSRPLVWFHAPSVGEGLQARAVMDELRMRRPDVQLVYTFFSPSAEVFARRLGADCAEFLPLDLPAHVARALDALAPSAIAFSKTEVWPNLSREADRRGIPMVLLSATLPAGSSRLRWPGRLLLGSSHSRLARVAAIAEADAERFALLGVPPERRIVMGDARFDQVRERASRVDPSGPLLAPLRDGTRPTLVAGSTWPADEDRLIGGAAGLLRDGSLRLILVPHEPTAEHLSRIEGRLDRHGLPSIRLSATPPADLPVILVDRVGVLGELYALADIALVGGGFGSAGLHSVLEPAAFGIPVLFGPRHSNAREAAELLRRGAGFVVEDSAGIDRLLGAFLRDPESRRRTGTAALRYVEEGLGAAARGASLLEELLAR